MAVSVSRTKKLALLLFASGLAACGGGGGGDDGGSANQSPLVDAGVEVAARELTLVTLTAMASDPDGDSITYAWTQTDGAALDLGATDGAMLEFMLPDIDENTPYELMVTVSDGNASASDTVVVTATINGVPVVNVGAAVDEREGATVAVTGSALDPDGSPITSYAWTQTGGVPDLGLGTVTAATLEVELPDIETDTVFEFELAASDGVDTGTATLAVTALANRAPEITVTAPGTVNELTSVEMAVAATEPDGDNLSYEWELLSADLDIALSSETLPATQFTSPAIDTNAVAAEFRVTVTDDAAFPESASETFTVAIAQEVLIIFEQYSVDGPKLYQGYTDGIQREIFASDANWQLNSYLVSPTREHIAILISNTMDDSADIRIIDLQTLAAVSALPAGTQPLVIVPDAAWAPDGSRLAMRGSFTQSSVYELAVVNADGSNARIVATPFVDKRSAITGYQPGDDGYWDSDPDTADGIDEATADVLDLAWSPDSEWLAFRMQATPRTGGSSEEVSAELLTVRLSDAEIFTVSDMFVQRFDCATCATWRWESDVDAIPDYRPDAYVSQYEWKQRDDGQWLAYRSFERRNSNDLLNMRLWAVDATGANRTQVANFEVVGIDKVDVEQWAWSPDGSYFAWTERLADAGAEDMFWFMTAPFTPGVTGNGNRIDTAALISHTLPGGTTSSAGGAAHVQTFRWSPNSHDIAFKARLRHPTVYELYVIDRDWQITDGTLPAVAGDLFRDDYDASTWDGAFYRHAADGYWDTEIRTNKGGDVIDSADGTPDGVISGMFTWSQDGDSLYFSGALRMRDMHEHYRWDVGADAFEVLSHNSRDERNNETGIAIPDGIADTAIGHLNDTDDLSYGISRADIWDTTAGWDIAEGSGAPPALLYAADERHNTMLELWMTRDSGTPLLLSDLFHDGDGDGLPDSDTSEPRDGIPNGYAGFATSLGGSRVLYVSEERNTFDEEELLYVDAADPAGTRQLLSTPVDGSTNELVGALVAFPDGKQIVVY